VGLRVHRQPEQYSGTGIISGTVTVVTPFGTTTKPFSAPFTY
jgi:hypothetical protein